MVLDTTHGLGAVQKVLQEMGVRVSHHRYVGVNYVRLQSSGNDARWYKLQTCGTMGRYGARYVVRNFLSEDAPSNYLFAAFEPKPILWHAPREEIVDKFHYVSKHVFLPSGESGMWLPNIPFVKERGGLAVQIKEDHEWRVKTPSCLHLRD